MATISMYSASHGAPRRVDGDLVDRPGVRRHRAVAVAVAAALVVVAGCGSADSTTPVTEAVVTEVPTLAPTSLAPTTLAPTSTPITSAPSTLAPSTTVASASTVAPDFVTAATTACAMANQEAYADAERLGYWSKELSPSEQAEYYTGRATQVDGLVAALRALTPDAQFADSWPALLVELESYAAWARDNAAAIESSGATMNVPSPASIQDFRAAFELGFGNACQDLFDMN